MDVDRMLFPVDPASVTDQRHVFVTGLARSGTTILMRELHATGAFRSLTYRDMPFVLAPNLWARLSGRARRQATTQERAHGDGIMVDFDSPEALEEVFWRVACEARYIWEDRLVPMQATDEERKAFQRYVAAILRETQGKRYLSKNNNNILRLPDLARAFPEATILIPFRDPLDHARSLMRQHQAFLARHVEDRFALTYMTWLAHHEFGAGQKPFIFEPDEAAAVPAGDPAGDLGYWLQLWRNTYSFVMRKAPEQAVFVCYERFCNETDQIWPQLCARLGLPKGPPVETLRRANAAGALPEHADLLQDCRALYEALCACSP
jgi:hypothetical protein